MSQVARFSRLGKRGKKSFKIYLTYRITVASTYRHFLAGNDTAKTLS